MKTSDQVARFMLLTEKYADPADHGLHPVSVPRTAYICALEQLGQIEEQLNGDLFRIKQEYGSYFTTESMRLDSLLEMASQVKVFRPVQEHPQTCPAPTEEMMRMSSFSLGQPEVESRDR